jgi:Protein of unknown function (DUF3828)
MHPLFKFFALCLAFFTFFACNEAPKGATNESTTSTEQSNTGAAQNDADFAAITDVVHNFYKWYETFTQSEDDSFNYVNFSKHPAKLDMAKLEAYHANLIKSGFVSTAYTANDQAYLKKHEEMWKSESIDEPLSGIDYDRVFCGQDWDINAFTTGAIAIESLGPNQVRAALESGKVELAKENGKWLITKITCE